MLGAMAVLGAAVLLLAAAGPIARAETTPAIPAGTHVLLRMVNSVSTRTAQPGDRVYLETASPIALAGRILVPVNSYVQGVVTHCRRPGRLKGKGELGIRLETLTLPSGQVWQFSPVLESVDAGEGGRRVEKRENLIREGPGHSADVARVVILAGSGASIGGLADRSWRGAGIGAGAGAGAGIATVLLSRGRELELARGATLDVVLDRPLRLENR
jgi:type IV secretion system protein VirB10